jgi:prefoldin subunit 5
MIRKDAISAILLIICVTTALYAIIPTMSSPIGVGDYDPWLDIDDDGKIDMKDIGPAARAIFTSGYPVKKTALLIEVNTTFTTLLSNIETLNSSLMTLQSQIENLNTNYKTLIDNLNASLLVLQSQVEELNATATRLESSNAELNDLLVIMNATKLGKPDADSGWMPIQAGTTHYIVYDHNLNTTNVLVYLIGKYSDTSAPYIHPFGFGGDNYANGVFGASWSDLTSSSIKLTRFNQDPNWVYIRVIMWKIPQ